MLTIKEIQDLLDDAANDDEAREEARTTIEKDIKQSFNTSELPYQPEDEERYAREISDTLIELHTVGILGGENRTAVLTLSQTIDPEKTKIIFGVLGAMIWHVQQQAQRNFEAICTQLNTGNYDVLYNFAMSLVTDLMHGNQKSPEDVQADFDEICQPQKQKTEDVQALIQLGTFSSNNKGNTSQGTEDQRDGFVLRK